METAGNDPVATKERSLERILMGEPVSDRTRATVLAQSQNTAAPEQAAKDFAAGGMAAETPATGSFLAGNLRRNQAQQQDRQAAVIAGLLLGSPEFQRR